MLLIIQKCLCREDIFLTTKVWVTEFGYEKAKASVEEFLRKLQTDYLDLVLIHQCLSDYYGAYRALEDLYDEGKIRAIGISNFSAERMKPCINLPSAARKRIGWWGSTPPDFSPFSITVP